MACAVSMASEVLPEAVGPQMKMGKVGFTGMLMVDRLSDGGDAASFPQARWNFGRMTSACLGGAEVGNVPIFKAK